MSCSGSSRAPVSPSSTSSLVSAGETELSRLRALVAAQQAELSRLRGRREEAEPSLSLREAAEREAVERAKGRRKEWKGSKGEGLSRRADLSKGSCACGAPELSGLRGGVKEEGWDEGFREQPSQRSSKGSKGKEGGYSGLWRPAKGQPVSPAHTRLANYEGSHASSQDSSPRTPTSPRLPA
eukprot:scaffold145724_cov15-Tisochrysis_lutea.AAC.1